MSATGLLVLDFAEFPIHTFKITADNYESWQIPQAELFSAVTIDVLKTFPYSNL